MRFLISVTLFFLLVLPALAVQPAVRVAHLIPRDLSVRAQENDEKIIEAWIRIQEDKGKIRTAVIESREFFQSEMEDHDKDSKTFKLEVDNNGVVIHPVVGGDSLEGYKNLASNGNFVPIADEIDEALDYVRGLRGDDKITAIFITGMGFLARNATATTLLLHPPQGGTLEHDDFTGYLYCFIPVNAANLSYITAHELGHTFGLSHNRSKKFLMYEDPVKEWLVVDKSLDDMILSEDEARWLHCHRFFNDQNTVKSVPSITKIHIPELFFRKSRNEFQFKVENSFEMHQAYLLVPTNGSGNHKVVAYDYMPDKSITATFDVRTSLLGNLEGVRVSLLDERGNYVHYDIDLFDLPAALADPRAAPSMFVPKTIGKWATLKQIE